MRIGYAGACPQSKTGTGTEYSEYWPCAPRRAETLLVGFDADSLDIARSKWGQAPDKKLQ